MNKKEFLKRAIDNATAFFTGQAEATAVNPNVWDTKLREYEEANLVFTPLCEQFDFRGYGVDYTVTIDDTPSAAAALTETVDIPITAFTTRNITFTPTEQGAGYQITRKEAVRAFFNVADRMVKKLAYSMALRKDNLGLAVAVAGTGNSLMANGVTVATNLASTDTLGYDELTKGARLIEDDLYTPKLIIVNPTQKQQLLDLQTVNRADEFGTRSAVEKGLIGELFGLKIYVTTQIATSSNVATAVMMGESGTGEVAVGYAIKRDPMIEKEYHARGRFWDIVGHEEYDFQVLHSNAICTVKTYA